jgi:CO dehydrogenase nickel-insertion accessory protein CooC1
LPGFDFLGFVPYDPAIIDAEVLNGKPLEASQPVLEEVNRIYTNIMSAAKENSGAGNMRRN